MEAATERPPTRPPFRLPRRWLLWGALVVLLGIAPGALLAACLSAMSKTLGS